MTEPAAFDWHMPVQVQFGSGCTDHLAEALGRRSVVVLAFEPAARLGLQAAWSARLGPRLRGWHTVPEGLATLAVARHLAPAVWNGLAAEPDCVLLAVGGGSTLDLAKLLRCRPREGGFDALCQALRGQEAWPAMERAPLWLVPTTAGTGSEVTRWATLWDTDGEVAVKRSLDEPWGYAERALVDPALTLSCPLPLTRDVALDSLAHALEALWNRHATPLSNRLAVKAARRVLVHLPELLQAPQSLPAREQLSLAALEAGMAFSQTRTALAHALSYALTLEQGVPHGLACALWLPTACQLAVGRSAAVDGQLEQVFDAPPAEVPQRLAAWLSALGVAAGPEAVGVQDAAERVRAALASPRGRNFIAA